MAAQAYNYDMLYLTCPYSLFSSFVFCAYLFCLKIISMICVYLYIYVFFPHCNCSLSTLINWHAIQRVTYIVSVKTSVIRVVVFVRIDCVRASLSSCCHES